MSEMPPMPGCNQPSRERQAALLLKWRKGQRLSEAEKAEIKKEAERLEEEVKEFDHKSDASMHLHHRWAQSMTAIQIAISLAAITLLTRKKWLNYATFLAAGLGGVLAAMAGLHI